jgi:hypothetical protein
MKLLVRILVGLAVLAGFLYLFLHTARDVRSEPYTTQRQHLQPWTLSIEAATRSTSPMLVVRPPQEFASGLFGQVFQRMMESMKGSVGGGMPLVLRDEYELALAGRYTPQALLDAARMAGVESSTMTPVCVAVRRISEPGLTRQMYFVVFDAPAVVQFRQQLANELQNPLASGTFDPAALSPVMIIGASDADFDRWLPVRADSDTDCVAPVTID